MEITENGEEWGTNPKKKESHFSLETISCIPRWRKMKYRFTHLRKGNLNPFHEVADSFLLFWIKSSHWQIFLCLTCILFRDKSVDLIEISSAAGRKEITFLPNSP